MNLQKNLEKRPSRPTMQAPPGFQRQPTNFRPPPPSVTTLQTVMEEDGENIEMNRIVTEQNLLSKGKDSTNNMKSEMGGKTGFLRPLVRQQTPLQRMLTRGGSIRLNLHQSGYKHQNENSKAIQDSFRIYEQEHQRPEKLVRAKGLRGDPHKLHYQDLIMVPDTRDGDPNPGRKYNLKGKGTEIDRRSLLYQIRQNSTARNAGRGYGMKFCFVVTLYNESCKEFKDSMKGIIQSIYELRSQSEFPIAEDDIAIFFIADGLDKVNPALLKMLEENGLYDDSIIDNELMVHKKATAMDKSERDTHKFEYMWKQLNRTYNWENKFQTSLQWDEIDKLDNPINNVLHLFQCKCNYNFGCTFSIKAEVLPQYNFFFGIKHLNGGKLDSHLWFFRGICSYVNPKYCFLVDLGTEPRPNSISRLYSYMEYNDDCGGCCGEIEVDTQMESPTTFAYWMVLTQFVEYKISHFIDKAFEALFGFVSVLPGAFSMYRWDAIAGDPLIHYFKGLNKKELSCAQANMYLAEDRIMCLSIVTNKNRSDYLFYVPGAKAVTDPPNKLGVFIKQRRRWINGSNFATLFVLANFNNIYRTEHKCGKKLGFSFLFFYQVLNALLSFMLPGCSYAAFSVLARAAFAVDPNDPEQQMENPAVLIENLYLIMMLYILMWSLAKEVTSSGFFYGVTVFIFGLISYFSYYTLIIFARDSTNENGWITFAGLLLLLAVFTIPVIMNCHRINGITKYLIGFFVYLFFTPFYLNALVIYSFCNVHDVSWGNRPDSVGESDDQGVKNAAREKAEKEDKFKSFRTILLCFWMTLNIVACYFIINLYRGGSREWGEYYIAALIIYLGFIMISRLVGSIIFSITYDYCGCGFKRQEHIDQVDVPLPLPLPKEIPDIAMGHDIQLFVDILPQDLFEDLGLLAQYENSSELNNPYQYVMMPTIAVNKVQQSV